MNVSCRVCRDEYAAGDKEPLSLPCGHSFCRHCLRKVHLLDDLKCPTCSRVHAGQALHDLPVNLDLLSACVEDLSDLPDVGGEVVVTEGAEDEGYTSTTRSNEAQVGRTSMLEHAAEGDVDGLTEELEQGCDVNMESLLDGDYRRTALHLAAVGGHLDTLLQLISYDAYIHAKDTLGRRPLHLAAAAGHHHLLPPLLEHGALLEAQDNQGVRAVHLAAEGGHKETLMVLEERGCNLGAHTAEGITALHLAAKHGHMQVAAWLLQQGLSTSSRDSLRHTPEDYAAMYSHHEVIHLLRHGDGDEGRDMARHQRQQRDPQQEEEPLVETIHGLLMPRGHVASLVKRHGLLFNTQMMDDLRDHLKPRPASVGVNNDQTNHRGQVCNRDHLRPKSFDLHSDLVRIRPAHVDVYSDPLKPRPAREDHHNDSVKPRTNTGDFSDPLKPRPAREVHHNDSVKPRAHTGDFSDPLKPRPAREVHHNDSVKPRTHTGDLSDPLKPRPAKGVHHNDSVKLQPRVKLSAGERSPDDPTDLQSTSPPALDTSTEEKWLKAASEGDLETVATLLDAGVDAQARSPQPGEEGLQAVQLASWGGHCQVVLLLLDHGAHMDAHAKGRSAVHWAALGGHVQVLKVLKERGCHLMALTADGSTALHLAADYGNLDAVRWLLQEGADPMVEDKEGFTPVDLARRSGFMQIVRNLRGCESEALIPREDAPGEVMTVQVLSAGRYGQVCLVKDAQSLLVRKTVLLSNIPAGHRQLVQREVVLLQELNHPYLVHCVREVKKLEYIEVYFEYCEGGDLEQRIARQRQRGAPFRDSTVYNWTLMITLALKFLHGRGLVHGDVRPPSILLTQGDVVKLQEPCLGRGLPSARPTPPFLLAPEVHLGKVYDAKAEMWSLGCCLYQLATLKPHSPHLQTQPPVTIPGPLCEEFKQLVTSLLDPDGDRRPSATQTLRWGFLQEALERLLKDKQWELNQLKELEDDVIHQLAALGDARVM